MNESHNKMFAYTKGFENTVLSFKLTSIDGQNKFLNRLNNKWFTYTKVSIVLLKLYELSNFQFWKIKCYKMSSYSQKPEVCFFTLSEITWNSAYKRNNVFGFLNTWFFWIREIGYRKYKYSFIITTNVQSSKNISHSTRLERKNKK